MNTEHFHELDTAGKFALRYELAELEAPGSGSVGVAAIQDVLSTPVADTTPANSSLPLVIVGRDARHITDLLLKQRRTPIVGLRPIAVVGVDERNSHYHLIRQLADCVLPPYPEHEKLPALGQTLLSLGQHIKAMPRHAKEPALALLQFMHSRNKALEPRVDPTAPMAYDYALADTLLGQGTQATIATLEDMEQHGILHGKPVDRVFTCPDCNSYRVPVKELCPECKSPNLSLENSMHHFRCGYVAPESEFMVRGTPICPKCHSLMRHIGVEYNRPGRFSVCHDCGHWASEPELCAWCVSCNRYHSPSELVPTWIKRFGLTDTGSRIARAGSWDIETVRAERYGLGSPEGDMPEAGERYARELARLLVKVAMERKRRLAVYRVVLAQGDASDRELVVDLEKFLRRAAPDKDLVTRVNQVTFLVVLPRDKQRGRNAQAIRHDIAAKYNAEVSVNPIQAGEPDKLRAHA